MIVLIHDIEGNPHKATEPTRGISFRVINEKLKKETFGALLPPFSTFSMALSCSHTTEAKLASALIISAIFPPLPGANYLICFWGFSYV